MRIAVITTLFPSLSETFILDQITGLLDLGHDVRIYAWQDPAESVTHPDVARYDLLSRTRFIPAVPRSKALRLIKALWLVIANFHKGPTSLLRFVNMFVRRRKGLSLEHLHFLLYFLDKTFDVIHCHYGPNGLVGVFLKDAGIKAKVSTVFHGFDLSRHPLSKGPHIYDDLFRKGDLFLPVSEYWKNRLLEMSCDPDRIVVHRMGIDVLQFACIERRPKPGEPLKLLTVGRLVEKKGHEYALKAVSKLTSAGHKIQYTIAGDGPLREPLETLATQLMIADYTAFIGPVTRGEVIQLYSEAHVFLLPSVTAADGDMEGIPVVLMEALAAGLAVVATRHSGICEIIMDGQTGFLVPERDVDALAERIGCLLTSPHLWPALRLNGRRFVEENYDANKLNRRLDAVFAELCQPAGQSGTAARSCE